MKSQAVKSQAVNGDAYGAAGTLVVIGAGPKALAVAAKARVMADLGLPAPRVVIVDQHAVGGNWLPTGGWTDGRHRLGTSPEKDLGFPYRGAPHRTHAAQINAGMLEYSWMAFLVAHQTYTDWIDRGRPNPHHHVWARYLEWVAAESGVDVRIGTVETVRLADGGGWTVGFRTHDGTVETIDGDGLLVTGPGSSDEPLLDDPRVLSVSSFWNAVSRRAIPSSSRAAVIGGGETAASALDELVRHEVMSISVISPAPTIYTRGESYFENSVFSDPTGWSSLPAAERRDVIRRTDRGVFSVSVQENLLADDRINHLRGRVTGARRTGESVTLTLDNPGCLATEHGFDLVVDATGGRPLWFLDLFDAETLDEMELAIGARPDLKNLEDAIGHDLAVSGLPAPLYLPNLAGFAQGPGFPNLSCLGELSNRVLRSAVDRSAVAGSAARVGAI
ncbi:SidA/IucD/PvdA family monooxygenase [Gordonia sp. (in: high G+C Gram-positive bacteria)]|uniref:SidA/IucD/PvdA family monooxygenase n=1 Tax=Gordonia sp. (in: high G+C Gram-positive bacteria) TaxID=84139 RepID=UPI0016A6FB44|nr:SidA/IucD/PvdA family monooxygenase [Gordonia sp. (in: high G+C Gram-positive bacteria)]NLG47935.1 lysine N(6)-hydroxylase/L-ornithine N(5)-oxygenase family protein [Gordonia sp. (in: high G+C Gram-positive bacteria)]